MFISKKNCQKISIFLFTALFLFIFLLPNFVLAGSGNQADQLTFGGQQDEIGQAIGLGNEDPRIIIARVIRVFIGFLGIIAVGLIMYGGWLYMTSEGNEDKIEKAKNIIQNAFIGLVIILSAFAIATFILNRLYQTSTNSAGSGNGGVDNGSGIGILGSCAVESVYPEPYQDDIPRNTSIVISFREAIDARTICSNTYQDNNGDYYCCDNQAVSNGYCSSVAGIKQTTTGAGDIYNNSRFYISEQEDSCDFDDSSACVSATVYSRDNKTFVFVPSEYLGSPSEKIWYSAYMSNDIQTTNGEAVFNNCQNDYFLWQFEVSTRLDLTPPQVLEASDHGIFPPPDDIQNDDDIAKNAVIKINFNEAINPFTISGSSEQLDDYIKVACDDCAGLNGTYDCSLGGNSRCIYGNFEVANQYQTVEFTSTNKCGTNNCGEDIYCLPGGTNIRVILNAASLAVSCASAGDCTTRNPYSVCGPNNICQDDNGINYPMGTLDGILDMAMNSLDGDRDDNAEGKIDIYNENNQSGNGDNYTWSFWTSDVMDQDPPAIALITQQQDQIENIINNPDGVNFSNPILINFDELMMASSLKTFSKMILGNEHQGVNLFVLDNNNQIDANISIGHWLKSFDLANGRTELNIMHESFSDDSNYRARVGSRAKDLFQNCYMPCVGPNCLNTLGSCCNGATTINSTCY